jgi:hypothetical protein
MPFFSHPVVAVWFKPLILESRVVFIGSTVVEHSTRNPRTKDFNPTATTGGEKILILIGKSPWVQCPACDENESYLSQLYIDIYKKLIAQDILVHKTTAPVL